MLELGRSPSALATGEGFARADYVDPGTGKMKALITYRVEAFSGFLLAVANVDQTAYTIAKAEQCEKPGVHSDGQIQMLLN